MTLCRASQGLAQAHPGKPGIDAAPELRVLKQPRAAREAEERLSAPGGEDLRGFERRACFPGPAEIEQHLAR